MSKCKIIAIANQKGGVGKTTTTVNLGNGLSRNLYINLLNICYNVYYKIVIQIFLK